MSHTYVNALFHCVFSTKGRRRLITANLQERLWPFMGGIAREQGLKALTIGGVEDHVHLLLSMPATISIAKAIQSIKGASSKWVHDTFPEHDSFAWQEGYGAFSIGVSQSEATIAYIRSQPEHHRQTTFQEEFRMFLQNTASSATSGTCGGEFQSSLRDETERKRRRCWGSPRNPAMNRWAIIDRPSGTKTRYHRGN